MDVALLNAWLVSQIVFIAGIIIKLTMTVTVRQNPCIGIVRD